MFSSVNIKSILITGGLFIGVISAGSMWGTKNGLNKIVEATSTNDASSKVVVATGEARFHIVQIQQFLTDASLTGEMDSAKEAREHLQALEAVVEDIEKTDPGLKDSLEEVRIKAKKLAEVGLEMTMAYLQEGKDAGNKIMKRAETGFDAQSASLTGSVQKLADIVVKKQKESSVEQKNAEDLLGKQNLIFALASVFFTVVILFIIFRRVLPLIGIADQLRIQSAHLETAATAISESSQSLSVSNSEQSAATQETAASLEEVNSMVQKTSGNADQLESNIEFSVKSVEEGKKYTEEMLEAMELIQVSNKEIINQVEDNNKQLSDIVDVISEIGNKTKVINDIVFQTKLLSFNASVEAARAGEQGKGFAVVAEEVGNLASMSGTAAQEISQMLENGIKRVEDIVARSKKSLESTVDRNLSAISQGVTKANECGQAFETIVKQVNEVNQIANEMSTAISEQVRGLSEIGKAIGHLDLATQSNSEVANKASVTSKDLNSQFQQLDEIVNELLIVVNGTK